MKKDKIKKVHALLFDFVANYHEKFAVVMRKRDDSSMECNKNQKRALFMIKKMGSVTPTVLGKSLDMRKGSLTTLIDSLEQMNLLKRQRDLIDRRKIILSLTDQGELLVNNKMKIFEQHLTDLFKEVEESEIDEFLDNLTNVVNFIKKV